MLFPLFFQYIISISALFIRYLNFIYRYRNLILNHRQFLKETILINVLCGPGQHWAPKKDLFQNLTVCRKTWSFYFLKVIFCQYIKPRYLIYFNFLPFSNWLLLWSASGEVANTRNISRPLSGKSNLPTWWLLVRSTIQTWRPGMDKN